MSEDHVELPEPGSIFAFDLFDGYVGVCRVLKKQIRLDSPHVLIACVRWFGRDLPHLSEGGLLELLDSTHHDSDPKPFLLWTCEPPA